MKAPAGPLSSGRLITRRNSCFWTPGFAILRDEETERIKSGRPGSRSWWWEPGTRSAERGRWTTSGRKSSSEDADHDPGGPPADARTRRQRQTVKGTVISRTPGLSGVVRVQVRVRDAPGVDRYQTLEMTVPESRRFRVGRAVTVLVKAVYNR